MSLEDDWRLAAESAGIPADGVLLYPLRATGDHGAMYLAPGVAPPAHATEFEYTEADRALLDNRRDDHVLVVDAHVEEPLRLLLVRHEAEHVAQSMERPASIDFALRLVDALPNDWLYHAMPHERDADAAATALRIARRIEATQDDLEGNDRMLYTAPWEASDRASLPLRLLAFSLFVPDAFDDACRHSQNWVAVDPDNLAEALLPGGSALRSDHRHDLNGFLEGLPYPDLTPEEWDAMPRVDRNRITDDLRDRVVQKEAEIVEQLRDRSRE